MTPKLRTAFDIELGLSRAAYHAADLDIAFYHLERAHILGQRHVIPHLQTHVAMLWIGWRRRDAREIFGQMLRLLGVTPGAIFKKVPIGNTGGANVSALKPMPIPEDLAPYFE